MHSTASRGAFDNFPSAFRGALLRPDDEGYAAARLIYSNLSNDQGEAWRRGLWGSADKLARLRAVKAKWDPRNLFRFNKNITPE
jgi:hypothetical protein